MIISSKQGPSALKFIPVISQAGRSVIAPHPAPPNTDATRDNVLVLVTMTYVPIQRQQHHPKLGGHAPHIPHYGFADRLIERRVWFGKEAVRVVVNLLLDRAGIGRRLRRCVGPWRCGFPPRRHCCEGVTKRPGSDAVLCYSTCTRAAVPML